MKHREKKYGGALDRLCIQRVFLVVRAAFLTGRTAVVFLLFFLFASMSAYAAEDTGWLDRQNLFLTEQLNALSDFRVTYQWGDKVAAIDGNFLPYWLVTDQNLSSMRQQRINPATGSGLFLIQGRESTLPENLYSVQGVICNEEGVPLISEAALFQSMNHLFSTFLGEGTEEIIQFVATDGRTISFPTENKVPGKDTYDAATEFQVLKNAIIGHQTTEWRIFTDSGETPKIQSVGTTYIEINLSEQKLYYYENGEQKLVTDIVTGNEKLKRETPQGFFRVYGKQTNRTLRGDGYKAFVQYWMPIYRNIGIHDASWRKSFGGAIYTNAGSHGCINLPSQAARQLYGMIAVHTPVLVFK